MGRFSKNKGNSFERAISKELDKWWKVPAKTFWRTTQSGGWGEPGDVAPRQRANQEKVWFPFIIECKNYKAVDFSEVLRRVKINKIFTWWEQISQEQEKFKVDYAGYKKLLFFKPSSAPIYVAYSPEELVNIDHLVTEYIILCNGRERIKIVRWDLFVTQVPRSIIGLL